MATSSKNRNRRAQMEALRREAARRERRRTVTIVAVCAAVALAIVAVPSYVVFRDHQRADQLAATALGNLGATPAAASCGPITTAPANGNNVHEAPGTTISYDHNPPAYGPHWPVPAPIERKFYTTDDRPRVEQLVHNLEHGYTILWYDQTVADQPSQMRVVKAIAGKFAGVKFTDKFIAAPWTSKDGGPFPNGKHVALTHWAVQSPQGLPSDQRGIWQYCSGVSGQAVSSFMTRYPYTDSPEPGAA